LSIQQASWDLSELFKDVADPKINQAIVEVTSAADAFENVYRGRITQLSAEGLLQCLTDIEAFETKLSDLALYSSLSFSADM
jgi:oligoendopeptidase F